MLNYASQNVNIPPYALLNLSRIFASMTKLAWFETDVFKQPLKDIDTFLGVKL